MTTNFTPPPVYPEAPKQIASLPQNVADHKTNMAAVVVGMVNAVAALKDSFRQPVNLSNSVSTGNSAPSSNSIG